MEGRRAPPRARRLVLESLGLDSHAAGDMEIQTAMNARFNSLAACKQNDIVLLDVGGGGIKAARVMLHCTVDGECVSVLQMFTLVRRVPNTYLAIWSVNDGPYECWETIAVKAAVENCIYPNGHIGIVLPFEFA